MPSAIAIVKALASGAAMTSTSHMDRPARNLRSAWFLSGAGLLLAATGGIWWAWDANPAQGKALLLAGLLIAATGAVLARRPTAMPSRAVTVVAVLVTLFAGYGIWAAVATIISQRASRTQ
jgi:hypothetical protein